MDLRHQRGLFLMLQIRSVNLCYSENQHGRLQGGIDNQHR